MSPPKMRSKHLPEYLQKRIKIGAGGEDKACWNWTGKVKKARQRFRVYPAFDGYREHHGRYTCEAATPLVRHPITKNEEDARRHVYGAATMTPVCDVPTLKRYCDNPRCVSPYHVEPGTMTAAQRKRLDVQPQSQPEPEPEIEAETLTNDDVMALLKSKRPIASPEPEALSSAEEELGLPAGSIPWELYLEYCVWDEENPDDDDY